MKVQEERKMPKRTFLFRKCVLSIYEFFMNFSLKICAYCFLAGLSYTCLRPPFTPLCNILFNLKKAVKIDNDLEA